MPPPPMTGTMLDVLGLLLQAWEDETKVHGWQIMKSVRRSGPAVYAVLDRLEDAGWISGSWEEPGPGGPDRPRRRYYRLTPNGVESARQQAVVPSRLPPRPRPVPGFGLTARLRSAR